MSCTDISSKLFVCMRLPRAPWRSFRVRRIRGSRTSQSEIGMAAVLEVIKPEKESPKQRVSSIDLTTSDVYPTHVVLEILYGDVATNRFKPSLKFRQPRIDS